MHITKKLHQQRTAGTENKRVSWFHISIIKPFQQVCLISFFVLTDIRHNFFLILFLWKMGELFNWIRPGYELVTAKFQWNVQVPFLQTTDGRGQKLKSPVFSPQETPNSKWQLQVCDASHLLRIIMCHGKSTGQISTNFVEPVLVKLSILNNR